MNKLNWTDARGRPLSSYDAMEKRIAMLERHVVRLTRMLRRQKMQEEGALKPEIQPPAHRFN